VLLPEIVEERRAAEHLTAHLEHRRDAAPLRVHGADRPEGDAAILPAELPDEAEHHPVDIGIQPDERAARAHGEEAAVLDRQPAEERERLPVGGIGELLHVLDVGEEEERLLLRMRDRAEEERHREKAHAARIRHGQDGLATAS